MDTLEVLCVTMRQTDFAKLDEMRIASDVLFANQTDRTDDQEITAGGHRARMISTRTRGVGRNRNIALLYATGDILLLADDDVSYQPDYERQVLQAFQDNPRADLIIFSMESVENGQIVGRKILPDRRLHPWNALRHGTFSYAIRRSSLERANLWFSTRFGGGAEFGHGEDTLFLLDAFRRGLRVYSSSYCLGQRQVGSSTWFRGYNETYFFDTGVLYRAAFGRWAYPLLVRYLIRKRDRFRGSISLRQAYRSALRGLKHR